MHSHYPLRFNSLGEEKRQMQDKFLYAANVMRSIFSQCHEDVTQLVRMRMKGNVCLNAYGGRCHLVWALKKNGILVLHSHNPVIWTSMLLAFLSPDHLCTLT